MEELPRISGIAEALAGLGFTLRSGAADGTDSMFERGAIRAGGKTEIFLPWPYFNDHDSNLCNPSPDAARIAESFHPAWQKCYSGARKLHARNVHQVLGKDLCSPVEFVVYWTPRGAVVGGTAMAIRVAMARSIPVWNLETKEGRAWAENLIARR